MSEYVHGTIIPHMVQQHMSDHSTTAQDERLQTYDNNNQPGNSTEDERVSTEDYNRLVREAILKRYGSSVSAPQQFMDGCNFLVSSTYLKRRDITLMAMKSHQLLSTSGWLCIDI